jgi:flavodoxin
MKKAVIFYQSKTGTTQNYAQEISSYLQTKQINTQCVPVNVYHENLLQDADYLLLGCWTKGLMVVLQKPDEIWSDFAKKLSVPVQTKVALFATYKIGTGSMFKNMGKHLKQYNPLKSPILKSRNGTLSEKDKEILDEFTSN